MTSTSPASPPPVSVFISYSHKDEELREELDTHLANLKRQGKIQAWHDRAIEAGTEWDAQIKHQLETAEVVLLLITPRFMASDYCYDLEMQEAIERHNAGTARVIPIILKPVDWQGSPFGKLQVLPKDAKPVTKWADQDEAFLNVVQGIRRAVESLQAKKPTGALLESTPVVAPSLAASAVPQAGFSTYNPQTFTGRDAETADLTRLLSSDRRMIAIAGMTGIGKTALAERVVANLISQTEAATLPYYRFSLDDRSLTADFSISGAALLRTLGEEPTLADQQNPANLRNHLLDRLCSQPCRLQIDSLERLLRGNEQEGWSEFCDPLWLNLLEQFLARSHCPSQLLLTSQDIPADLDAVGSRYPQFWHCQTLQGLNPEEQQDLFLKLGLPQDAESLETLRRIGAFYDGHPLVLQVIADEICQPPFHGNLDLYWKHYAVKFAANVALTTDNLDRSRLFRRRVRLRVEQALQRLPSPARQMLCASAVFRRPVPIAFWQAMLTDDDPQAAFDTLHDRHLVEYTLASDNTLLVRQHNLVRSVAYSLLKTDSPTWYDAERQAAHLWLTAYEPVPDAPNLEAVRGYMEAFDHRYTAQDYVFLSEFVQEHLQELDQLQHWGYYNEMIRLYGKLLNKLSLSSDATCAAICAIRLGNAYYFITDYSKALKYWEEGLTLARKANKPQWEGRALGNLTIIHYYQANYQKAIEINNQYLNLSRKISDRMGEAHALGGLGVSSHMLGNYSQAISYYQEELLIRREINDKNWEMNVLTNLGESYLKVNRQHQAIECCEEALRLAKEFKNRYSKGLALKSLGNIYYHIDSCQTSIQFCQEALAIACEMENRYEEASASHILGLSNIKLGHTSKGQDSLMSALGIYRELGNRDNESEVLLDLANLHHRLGLLDLATEACRKALAITTNLCIPRVEECHRLMAELLEEAKSTEQLSATKQE